MLFGYPVMSNSLRPHGLQRTRPPCPSPFPKVCPSSSLLHQWCHPAISFSDVFFSFCPQSFPASRSFPMSWLFISGDWSFSISSSPSNEYSGLILFKIDWFDLIMVQRNLRSLLQHHSLKASVLWCSAFFRVQLSQPYVTAGKIITLTIRTFVGRVMSLLFNVLSRFVIAFLPRTNYSLTSCLQSPSTVMLKPKKRKSITASTFPPSICNEVMGPDAMALVFLIFSFKPAF